MIETNLLPESEKDFLRAMKLRRVIIVGLILVIVGVMAVSAFYWAMDQLVNIYSDSVHKELVTLQSQSHTGASGQEEEKIKQLNQTTAFINKSLSKQPQWTPLIEELVSATPAKVKYDTMIGTQEVGDANNNILISGEATTRDSLISFQNQLENV
ncbi:PilN domain-containing protein, partial [Patescibacteria group bacterium]